MKKCVVVEVQIQHRPVQLIADTGLRGIFVYEARLRNGVPGLRTVGSIKNASMGGGMQVRQATLPDVAFDDRNREVPALFLPSPAADMLPGIDEILGVSALKARRVDFDFSRKTLSWE